MLYLGVEAVLRKHFGTVLDWHYNQAHRDHWHVDDGTPVGYDDRSRSRVLFLQASLQQVFGHSIVVDGIAGPQTRRSSSEALRELSIEGALNTLDTWIAYLDAVAVKAFENFGPRTLSPSDLLARIYQSLDDELGDAAQRKPIEAAVNGFAMHPDVQRWLSS